MLHLFAKYCRSQEVFQLDKAKTQLVKDMYTQTLSVARSHSPGVW